jgi:pimeloyl-ACP methyl ester carboxylesterase
MPSSRTVSANGIEMFLLEQGEGPLVPFCHGWPELSYCWRHQIPAIAAEGFHVAAPDMRGFGRTSAPTDIKAYSIFDHVGDMVALVAALGKNQAVIVGHDWGAPVAWHAAMFRPDIFAAVAGLSVPQKSGFRGGLNWYRNIDRNWELTAPWQGAQIHQPSLFIAGSNDSVITGLIGAKRVADMERVLPNLRQKLIIGGAGHWIQQECAEAVNAALIAFLKDNTGAAQ